MEQACILCMDLIAGREEHPRLKKISELEGSILYKCCCCYAYLHKHSGYWEVISGGDTGTDPIAVAAAAQKTAEPTLRETELRTGSNRRSG